MKNKKKDLRCCIHILTLSSLMFLFAFNQLSANTYYVSTSSGNNTWNGTSPITPFKDLDQALSIANDYDTIKVAAGIYRPQFVPPGHAADLKAKAFYIDKCLVIRGGYQVNFDETTRAPKIYRSIITGGIADTDAHYDSNGAPTYSLLNNLWNLFIYNTTINAQSVLDGFEIRGGAANLSTNSFPDANCGGAIHFNGSLLVLANNYFHGNSAQASGGAIFLKSGDLQLINNRLWSNSSISGGVLYVEQGGVMAEGNHFYKNNATNGGIAFIAQTSKEIEFKKDTISQNSATNGGGIYVNGGAQVKLIMDSMLVLNNQATSNGGAIFTSSEIEISNSFFDKNRANSGAAIYRHSILSPGIIIGSITKSLFQNNRANSFGGALFLDNGATSLAHNSFVNNAAATGGAISMFTNEFSQINMNTFVANTADNQGGAMHCQGGGTNRIYNNTFVGNIAQQGGAGYFAGDKIGGNLFLGNGLPNGAVNDMDGTILSEGYNVFGVSIPAMSGPDDKMITKEDVYDIIPGEYLSDYGTPFVPTLNLLPNFARTFVVYPKPDEGFLNRVPVAVQNAWKTPTNQLGNFIDQTVNELPTVGTYFAGSVNGKSCLRPDDNKNWYIQKGGLGAKTGLNKLDAAGNLTEICPCLLPNDSIHITEGIYLPEKKLGTQNNTKYTSYYLKKDVVIKGGYKANSNFAINNAKLFQTIFDTDLAGDDLYSQDGELLNDERMDNFFHIMVVKLKSPFHEITFSGLTFRGGYADSKNNVIVDGFPAYDDKGAGVYVLLGTAIFDQCNIYGNEAIDNGSAIFLKENANLVINNSDIHHNLNSSTIYGSHLNFIDISHTSVYNNGPTSGANSNAVLVMDHNDEGFFSDLNVFYSSFLQNNMTALYLSNTLTNIYHSNIIGNVTSSSETGGLLLNNCITELGANVFGGNRSLLDPFNLDIAGFMDTPVSLGYNVFVKPGVLTPIATDKTITSTSLAAIYAGSVDADGRVNIPLVSNAIAYSHFPNPQSPAVEIFPRAPMLISQAWQSSALFGIARNDQTQRKLPLLHNPTYNSGSVYFDDLVAIDDTVSTYTNQATIIPILDNDRRGACREIALSKVDTLSVNGGPKHGSVVWDAVDSTFIYTSNSNFVGFDSIKYYIECTHSLTLRDTAVVRILVSRSQSDSYWACKGTADTLSMIPIPEVSYYWFQTPVGGNPEPTGNPSNFIVVTKDASAIQTWYAEPRSAGKIYGRIMVRLQLSQSCASVNPSLCELEGTILFKEDFGGNKTTHSRVSPIGLPAGLVSYNYDMDLNSAGLYSIRKRSAVKNGVWKDIDDHTYFNDNEKGYLLQVDGDGHKMQLYSRQLENVCESNLIFNFWLVNLDEQGILDRPNITMVLEDVDTNMEIARYRTGEIAETTWRQYGFNYTVPDHVQNVRLKIYSNSDDVVGGNDFAIDDIEIRLCVPKVDLNMNGQIITEEAICKGKSVELISSYVDDGTYTNTGELVGRWYKSYTGNVNQPNDWTQVGSDITATPVTNMLLGSDLSFNITETAYYRFVLGNASTIEQRNCRAASEIIHLVMLDPLTNYPDLRIQLLPTPARTINLSSYLDTIDLVKVEWTPIGISPIFTPGTSTTIGQLNTSDFAPGVSTYYYTIDNKCHTNLRSKVYVRTVNDADVKLPVHTVVICKDYGEALQVNQILGLETGVTWDADPDLDVYVTDVVSGQFAGARFFDAKAAYNGLSALYDHQHLGTTAKRVVFTYTRSNGQSYQLTFIITDKTL